ncbi:MAG: hypothetical protein L3J82_10470 [Planctomycetes bacterium]|nr:hypothetical protein [Planctomycetota bacterium]
MFKLAITGLLIASGLAAWGFWPFGADTTPKKIHVVAPEIKQSAKCSSCGDARHPTKYLPKSEFQTLINDFSSAPIGQNAAIDALCYYGPQTESWLASERPDMPPAHAAFLSTELSRKQVRLQVRVIDVNGVERVTFDSFVDIDQRGHHQAQAVGLTAPEVAGTIKRTGLHHIWARF